MQIALISVAPPYRGGISKHTSMLVDKISKTHSIDIINYSRQYPDWLFPGKSQYIEEKRDHYPSVFWIDSINPFSWFKTGNRLAKKQYNLVIFRFWNPFFAPALGVIASIIKKKSPTTKLISLCDNIISHEKTPLAHYFTSYLFKKLDGHLVQSTQTEKDLHGIIKTPIYEKRFHPIYSSFPEKMDKKEARAILKLRSNNIILFFGIIREYKGFDILLKSIGELKKKKTDFHLLVAGECYGSDIKYTKLISDLNISDYVTWHNRYIADDDVAMYFSAADVAALPYRSASQSGISQIAYYYDLPIIVTRVGGLPEIVDEGKSGFITESENPKKLSEVLYQNLSSPILDEMANYIKDYKKRYSWEYFVNGIDEIYQRI